jgi:uncharacterized protein (TIGR03437 family)
MCKRHRKITVQTETGVIPLLMFTVAFAPSLHGQSQIQIKAVVNAASFQSGMPSGGALATVFCSGLGGSPGTYTAPPTSPLPFKLAGVQVRVNAASAPILGVYIPGPGQSALAQINFQVPIERNTTLLSPSGNDNGTLVVSAESSVDGTLTGFSATSDQGSGGFFADSNGYAIAQHASDGSLVTLQNPARAGETIIAYGDDFFSVWPPPPMAVPAPQQPLSLLNVEISKGFGLTLLYLQDYPVYTTCPTGFSCGSQATTPPLLILFRGLAPGMTGVEQINFVVPASQAPGDWALFFNAASCGVAQGGCSQFGAESSPYATLPVR